MSDVFIILFIAFAVSMFHVLVTHIHTMCERTFSCEFSVSTSAGCFMKFHIISDVYMTETIRYTLTKLNRFNVE